MSSQAVKATRHASLSECRALWLGCRQPKAAADPEAAAAKGAARQLRSWATYARQPTAPAAVALALLYCTVMSMVHPNARFSLSDHLLLTGGRDSSACERPLSC